MNLTARGRIAVVGGLLAVVTAVRIVVDEPAFGIGYYALGPIILAAFWFGRAGALTTAATATFLFISEELLDMSGELEGMDLWIAAINRAAVYFGIAVLVILVLDRQVRLVTRVDEQRRRIEELRSLQYALTPPDVPDRPRLEVATSYTPAQGLVAGDFFLVAAGPDDSTTVVVGDVVGHGVEASRRASYVRAALSTFATFTSDPVRLLELANAALIERAGASEAFVTATCLNVAPGERELTWACAGHPPPWRLDRGEPLTGARPGVPLGLGLEHLELVPGRVTLPERTAILLFTDGLTEGRPAHRDPAADLELFGEERLHFVAMATGDAPPEEIVSALREAVQDFAGGALADDLCLVALRAAPVGDAGATGQDAVPAAA